MSQIFDINKGVPDEAGLRSTSWKLLLGYLPPDKNMWTSELKSQRLLYYVNKYIGYKTKQNKTKAYKHNRTG